eukprot:3571088-Prymnesium_polylepis.1
MGNSKDRFKAGSIVASESKVIGVSCPMTIGERRYFRFPMVTVNHGIKKFEEKNGIHNSACPYVLLALRRASREHGLEMHMPPWGADGHFSYPNT